MPRARPRDQSGNVRLGRRAARDAHALGIFPRVLERLFVDVLVVDHDVRLPEELRAPKRQEPRIARTCADEGDFTHAP